MSWRDHLTSNRREREIADELESHLRMATAEQIEKGQSRDAARREAEREMGDVRAVAAGVRSVWAPTAAERCLSAASSFIVTTGVRCGLAAALLVWFVAAEKSIFSRAYGLVTGALPGMDTDRVLMAVLAVSLVSLLALVALCANLANQSLDRRRSESVRAPGARVRISFQ